MEPRFDEAIYQALIANAPDGVLLVDARGIIVLANPQACELFGYTEEELLQQSIELLVPEDRRSGHIAQRQSFQNQPSVRPMGVGQDLTGLRRDGTEFPVEISLASTGEDQHRMAIAVVRDVSERREIEEERADLITIVQRQLERDRIARDLHDDIIQSVYAVGLSLQASRNDASLSRDDLIQRTIVELNGVISDIRAYMRELTSNDIDGHPAGMFAARLEELVSGADQPRWTVNVSLSEPPRAELQRQIHRLVKELVSNTQRHAQASKASITLIQDNHQLEITIQDDGVGFDPEHVREGAFGLNSVRNRVADLGGQVQIQSNPSSGTRARISIPLPARAVAEPPSP